jgi:hypothetical protein
MGAILSACLISIPEFGTENEGGSLHAIGASGWLKFVILEFCNLESASDLLKSTPFPHMRGKQELKTRKTNLSNSSSILYFIPANPCLTTNSTFPIKLSKR